MLRTIFISLLLPMSIVTKTIYSFTEYITYSPEEMLLHKAQCKKDISSNLSYKKDETYQMQRALATISANDADYIPKVINAGQIFYNKHTPYQLMHNGIKIIVNSYYDVQWVTDVIYGLRGHHEPQEEKCFYEVLKYIPQNATMIELGSYWGYYSLWFAFEIKNAKNYLIEPDPQRLAIGKKNFELNQKSAVFQRGFAGKIKDPEPNTIGAPYISIDDYMDKENITHLHILHADIQGSEAEMLETTVRHINDIDYFFISTHGIQIHQECLHFFKKYNCSILAETLADSGVNDGLIVAKRNGVPGPDTIEIKQYK